MGTKTGFDGGRGVTDGIPRSWFLVNPPGKNVNADNYAYALAA
jgi:hypothetical protein